jgi:hypothetical protein
MNPELAAVLGVIVGGVFVAALVPLLRSCSRPVAIAAFGVAILGVAVFTVDLASVADLVRQSNLAVPDGEPTASFAAIAHGVRVSALEGAALVAFAALLATIDVQRKR